MSAITIEIIAVGEEDIYSVGAVKVSKKGDVYLIDKIKDIGDIHLSRHSSARARAFLELVEKNGGFEFMGVYNDFDIKQPLEKATKISRPTTILRRRS